MRLLRVVLIVGLQGIPSFSSVRKTYLRSKIKPDLLDKFRGAEDVKTTPHIPDGQRVYCIGDIHGRLDLLLQMHEKILIDASDYKI